MELKNLVLLGIFIIFCVQSKTKAQTVECDYENRSYVVVEKTNFTEFYYSCFLNTSQSSYNEIITKINGQHKIGFTDENIKWLTNHENNQLKIFSSIFCEKFPNLEAITILNANLMSVGEDSLSNCQNLKHLRLDRNKIPELSENVLNKNVKLTNFWIWNNKFTILHENLFANQVELEHLALYDNQIRHLPGKIFNSLVKLEVLYLDNNKLQEINPEWFKNLQNLKWLDLRQNLILEVPSNVFSALKSLEKLWIFDNKIIQLNSNSFNGLEKLELINLSDNEISNLPARVFEPLKSLDMLQLDNNKLTIIHSDSFGVHKNLTKVWLDGNRINAIDSKIFENSSLIFLDMSNNVCSRSSIENIKKINLYLKKCFDNYKPRPVEVLSCGKSIMAVGNVVGGTHIEKGSNPWIAALFSTLYGDDGLYFCGGTIVSSRKVVTAAHCIQEKKLNHPAEPNDIFVAVGVHDIFQKSEIEKTRHNIQKIYIHPSWNVSSERYDADIAVLVLKDEIEFGSSIQPICMMESNSIMTKMTKGFVVGYGKSEDDTKEHENIPKMLEIPFHRNEVCFLANNLLALFSSTRTFCGGSGNGTGICTGDSGSGVVVNYNGRNYFRGIVSSSLYTKEFKCDVNTYSIFTDVLKFNDWIKEIPTDDIDN